MGLLICKDVGCELTYCQSTISDPYPSNRPFNNCDQLFRNFNSCIQQQIDMYETDSLGLSMQDYTLYMLEKRKKEKYSQLFLENNNLNQEMKEKDMSLNNKVKLEMKMDMENNKSDTKF